MSDYSPPLADLRFAIQELADLDAVTALPGCEDATPDLVDAVLEEAGRFAAGELAPLNRIGDQQGCVLDNGVVRTPDGFKDAYRRFVEGGWNGVQFESQYGGQGLPLVVATAVAEMWGSANMAFSLCSMLTQGGIDLLIKQGSDELKALFLSKMVSGEWNGTMNLTEPQAGSDLAQVKTRAVAHGDHYLITGQKIFITYGDHDLTSNIIHMVLARTPDAPRGVRGLSLFVVPKFIPDDAGDPGVRNDVRCVSLEHKLGIHASPTAVMSYGDDGGAVGYLLGEENRGLEYMFIMMNNARLAVGLQGVSISERALQQAVDFSRQRIQGRGIGGDATPVAIIHHADVRRMLLDMRALTEATRALALYVAAMLDKASKHSDPDTRAKASVRVDLLIPVVKGWSTDVGIHVADTGLQVHGGMGYIEETGAAQHLRDARIAAIYEGTNGIQAMDLIGRKVAKDKGAAIGELIDEVLATATKASAGDKETAVLGQRLDAAARHLQTATAWLLSCGDDPDAAGAGAVHYLELVGIIAGGWLMTRAAIIAGEKLDSGSGDASFMHAKRQTARFFADHYLVRAASLAITITEGAPSVRVAPGNDALAS